MWVCLCCCRGGQSGAAVGSVHAAHQAAARRSPGGAARHHGSRDATTASSAEPQAQNRTVVAITSLLSLLHAATLARYHVSLFESVLINVHNHAC